MKSRKYFGFTLAEVLITLGIIGVVAAMTIPTLIEKYKIATLHASFNKTYAVIQQALKITMQELEINNSGDFAIYYNKDKNILQQNFIEINNIWVKNFQGATKINKAYLSKNRVYIHDFWGNTLPYAYSYPVNGTIPDNTFLILPNGAQISYIGYDGNVNYQQSIALVIFFDTNGPFKGPNRIGYDMFYYYGDGTQHSYYLAPSCLPLDSAINSYWQAIQMSTCSLYAIKNINPYDSSKKYWDSLYKPKSWWQKLK